MTIENTSERDPIVHLAGMMDRHGGGISGYIEGMESQGQREVVASQSLPVQADWEALEALGVRRVGEPRDLFVDVVLPDGWTREASDHSMHSHVVDDRGIQRISVFYKAAFYDRRASASVVSVGDQAATEAIYGDDDAAVSLPAKWDLFTADERASYASHLREYIEEADASDVTRSVYGPRVPRAHAALRLVGDL